MTTFGFVGTGTLAEAVIRGLQKTEAQAHRFLLSPRSEERGRALAAAFSNTERLESNEAVVAQSDIIFLGVLPKQLGDLKGLPFRADHVVVSFLAGAALEAVRQAVAPAQRVVRVIPLPGIEFGKGAILMMPQDAEVAALFAPVGELVIPETEQDLNTISIGSGLMSAHFALQNTVIGWMRERGIQPALASRYVRALYSGLGELALEMDRRGDPLPPEEYETRGGINEMARTFLESEGWFETMGRAMDRVEEHLRTLAKPQS
jgi:pyrroline-5-carboxylate reductase